MSEFVARNLADIIEDESEERTREFLSFYSCPPNEDIESFLHEQAIPFSKSFSARTFLVMTAETNLLVGYFTIAQKSLVMKRLDDITRSLEKKSGGSAANMSSTTTAAPMSSG
jgi:hypothetical protein